MKDLFEEPAVITMMMRPAALNLTIALAIFHIFAFDVEAFHDCYEGLTRMKARRRALHAVAPTACNGGICAGLKGGPHESGNVSYPVGWNGESGLYVESLMTVPEPPRLLDGITYYIWTDIFFGDASLGRMNQMVPQLILGNALDGSSGPPSYKPRWGDHSTWSFASHYFFELFNETVNKTEGHAAYGDFFPVQAGEEIKTKFEILPGGDGMDEKSPMWKLTMEVVGDSSRTSVLEVHRPYMGMGSLWETPTTSWAEDSYRNVCINACWELYGADDSAHMPTSGNTYKLYIEQPELSEPFKFGTWERDEGNGLCPNMQIAEHNDGRVQTVAIEVGIEASDTRS